MLQLTAPAPGAALVGTFGWGEQTHVAISLFLAARETALWEAWIDERFPRSA